MQGPGAVSQAVYCRQFPLPDGEKRCAAGYYVPIVLVLHLSPGRGTPSIKHDINNCFLTLILFIGEPRVELTGSTVSMHVCKMFRAPSVFDIDRSGLPFNLFWKFSPTFPFYVVILSLEQSRVLIIPPDCDKFVMFPTSCEYCNKVQSHFVHISRIDLQL